MDARSRSVLVVHPNVEFRKALSASLSPHRVVAVESRRDAARYMNESPPELIVAHSDEVRKLLLQIERSAPDAIRIFLCGREDQQSMEELVEVAAEGHIFTTLEATSSPAELSKLVERAFQSRLSARLTSTQSLRAQFKLNGRLLELVCLDIGNFGAGFRVPPELPIAGLTPGAILRDVNITRGGRPVFHSDEAIIRHIQTVRDQGGGFLRLSVIWRSSPSELVPEPASMTHDPVRILAALRRAIRRKSLVTLRPADEQPEVHVLREVSIEVRGSQTSLCGQNPEGCVAIEGDVMRLAFEVGGKNYVGWTSVMERGAQALRLSVPRAMTVQHRRNTMRFRPSQGYTFRISFDPPFGGDRIERPVFDLHAAGLSFPFDASNEVLPIGSLLELELTLPGGGRVRCGAEVRALDALVNGNCGLGFLRPYRCGVRLIDLPDVGRDAVLKAFIASRCPSAADGTEVPFREIWQLMKDSNYNFHPDHPFADSGAPSTLVETHSKLSTAHDLNRSIIYLDNGTLIGHASGFRIHSRTWLVQHLAVRPGFHRQGQAAHELTSILIELGEAMDDVDFLRYSWRTDNRWPNRLGSWLARTLGKQGLSWLRHFNYMRLPLDGANPAQAKMAVRPASRDDHLWIERYFRGRGELVKLLSEDLVAERIELRELGERFKKHGLHRARKVFVVDGEHAPLGVALLEEGSPGLNLIEKTNSFSLVCPDPEHPWSKEALRSLISTCIEHERMLGRPSAVALALDSDVDLHRELGFEPLGRFAEWFFHRSMVRSWYDLWKSIFERVQRESDARGGEMQETA